MLVRRFVLALGTAVVAALPVLAQEATAEPLPFTVNVVENETFGTIFVDTNGMTLYTFDRDTAGTSACVERCLEAWPALTVESADALTADESLNGTFGTITREDDGTLQVTYNGWPLYTWMRDAAPGDVTGHNVGRVWWVAEPATVAVSQTEELGRFLVSDTGMTLYLFTNDEEGVSNCADQCLAAWPAYTVESEEDLQAGAHVGGTLGTITREDDGTLQVTYNGWPLYYFASDAAMGDTTGQDVGGVWFVVTPETLVTASSDDFEAYLTDANGYTLYTFTNDTDGTSSCAGDCATAWPPLLAESAEAVIVGADVTGEIGRRNVRMALSK